MTVEQKAKPDLTKPENRELEAWHEERLRTG